MTFYDLVRRAAVVCATCGERGEDLLQCPCRTVFYCSTDCQMTDWTKGHHNRQCTMSKKGTPTLSACHYCGTASYRLHSCQCGIALYCDVVCQHEHWPVHRVGCGSWSFTLARAHSRFQEQGTQKDKDSDDDDDDEEDLEENEVGTDAGGSMEASEFSATQRPTSAAFLAEKSFKKEKSFKTSSTDGLPNQAMARKGSILASQMSLSAATSMSSAVSKVFSAARHSVTSAMLAATNRFRMESANRQRASGDPDGPVSSLSGSNRTPTVQIASEASLNFDRLLDLVYSSFLEERQVLLHVEAEMYADVLADWMVVTAVHQRQLCGDVERQRRLRIVVEYNMWAKQQVRPWTKHNTMHGGARAR